MLANWDLCVVDPDPLPLKMKSYFIVPHVLNLAVEEKSCCVLGLTVLCYYF